MKRFIESEDRLQATLLPDSLEDYVTAHRTRLSFRPRWISIR